MLKENNTSPFSGQAENTINTVNVTATRPSPSLVEFLKHVLPNEGWYCWWYNENGFPKQGFVRNIDELASALLRIDAAGYDAYFACSTFKTTGSRKHENVHATRAFWLDLDCGSGKAYVDFQDGAAALHDFCAKSGLPEPEVVRSGNGLHAWWIMDRNISPIAWPLRAEKLKELCDQYGLHADHSRTTDISSILRAPGTHNRKAPINPRPVMFVGELFEEIAVEQMFSCLPVQETSASKPRQTKGQADELSKAAANIYQTIPSYAALAVEKCNQLKNFRDKKGNFEEPLWYAGLGVLAHCTDGEQCAQEWSSGHPTYSREETDRKLKQARDASDPIKPARSK